MYSRAINSLRKKLQLTPLQYEVLIGSMLGDGYLYPTVSGSYAYFRVAHGPKQKEYVWWKYQLFNNWVLSPPRYQLQNKHKPELGGYWWFKTIAHQSLLDVRRLFYAADRKKRVPSNISKLLRSPLSLAVWYGDDGTVVSRTGIRIQSEGFTEQENEKLLRVLANNFGVNGRLQRNGGNGYGWSIGFGKFDSQTFIEIIRKHLPDCLRYKLLAP